MSPELPSGTITFLFTDIEGSTRLLQELGDRYGNAQENHAAITRRALAETGGVEIRTEGDSFFVVFPSAPEALRAAVTVQRELAAPGRPEDVSLRVRMGLHTGEGVLGGDDYLGIDVNKAARIAAAANGGQVLISAATRALVEDTLVEGVTLRDLGQHRLKDLLHPERLSDLVIDGLPSDFPPPRTLEVPTNLPAELTSFVGREPELRSVGELLGRVRLVTLTGPGGAGKTRLALRAAAELRDRFPDGVFLVELAAIDDPHVVPATIAAALGMQQEGIFPRPVMDILRSNLRDRELLLVLDNFEHVLDAAPAVAELLASASRLRALVTSRSALHLTAEHDLPVPPLSLTGRAAGNGKVSGSEAAGLFAERATAVDPSFELTDDNEAAVTAVCARLDGLPLAIELAASRISVLSPEAMLERFERSLPLLPEGPRDLPERHRTLRSAIAWSYDLLAEPLRPLFRDLSCFSGGWTVEAAEAVCSTDAGDVDILDWISALVDASLARRGGSKQGRFDMLTTIREYGLDRLESEGEAPGVRRRHAAFFLELSESAEPHLRELEEGGWLDRLDVEHDNLRAALRWAADHEEGEIGMRLVSALWRFWQLRGHLTEGRRLADEILSLPSAAGRTAERAKALGAAGSLAYWQFDAPAVRKAYSESLEIWEEIGDPRGIAQAALNMSYSHAMDEDPTAAFRLLERSRTLFEEIGDRRGVGDVLWILALINRLEGDLARSRSFAEESLRLHRAIGDRFGQMDALHMLGRAAFQAGDIAEARRSFLETLDVYARLGNRTGIAIALDNLAAQANVQGDPVRALRLGGASAAVKEAAGGEAPPVLVDLQDPREGARSTLSEDQIRAAWEEGRAMTVDQAVALVRAEPEG
jgi:predicted ATPase/class 3 adenylate cyclase